MQKKQSVTAADIARECGVSQATVSYVINQKPGKKISESTRRLVMETAARMGYVPSATARSMRTSRAMSIGVVTGRNNINIGFNHALRGIRAGLDAAGYSITLLNGGEEEPEERDYLRYYASGRIDGLLFLFFDLPDSTARLLEGRGIPYLLLTENGVQGGGLKPNMAFERAIHEAAVYCGERGFEHIRFFSLQYGEVLYSYKYDLFSKALEDVFPEASLRRIIIQTKDPGGSDMANEGLLERLRGYLSADRFTLAVTPNQRLGWLMQTCILKEAFTLPQRIKHICLASSHVFHLAYPTVTSIDVPLTRMGEFAAKQLIRILNGDAPEQREFSCTLKQGISTE